MMFELWDIDQPLISKRAVSDAGLPESDAEWRTWEEAQRAINTRMGESYDGGHSEYDPSVWMMGKHAPSHEKYQREEPASSGSYHMPGITGPEDDDYDDEEERQPAHYHVATGPVDSNDRRDWTEHEYTMFEHPSHDYNPDNAWDYFQEDHPQYDVGRNPSATHEVKHVHPVENHDSFHRDLDDEEGQFQRISQHGLQRESPEMMGHRAYRMEEPSGVVHRLWHSPYSVNGPGWHTSRYDPAYGREYQPTPWTEHTDSASGDSLGDALSQIEVHKRHPVR